MPPVKVNLYASLRSRIGGQPSAELEIAPGETVGQILDRLAISRAEARIIFVDGRPATPGQALVGGEQLGVFPAIGGG